MSKKGWTDPQGREGKGYGVYRFRDKYGTNIDGYSPIYSPDEWSESGETFTLGIKGLIAWAGVLALLLGAGVFVIVSTSQLGS
jgi:photosystem II protein